MTPQAVANYIRLKTRSNSTTLTDSDLLILWNIKKDEVCQRGLEIDEDIFELPVYMNLVANQREYPLNSNILSRIDRVEAKLDGTNWLKLTEVDLTELDVPVSTEANITAQFSNEEGNAFYDIMRKSLWLYSGTITSVTAGLKVWENIYPADLSAMSGTTDMSVDPTTTSSGTPREFHKVIADGVIIEWKSSREKPIPLTEREVNWEFNLEKAIQTLKKTNYDRQVIGDIPSEDGSDY
jgi:hypothetical protein